PVVADPADPAVPVRGGRVEPRLGVVPVDGVDLVVVVAERDPERVAGAYAQGRARGRAGLIQLPPYRGWRGERQRFLLPVRRQEPVPAREQVDGRGAVAEAGLEVDLDLDLAARALDATVDLVLRRQLVRPLARGHEVRDLDHAALVRVERGDQDVRRRQVALRRGVARRRRDAEPAAAV